jgi:hypothetical protein
VANRLDQGTLRCELVHGRRGVLARESVVQHSPLFVAAEVRDENVSVPTICSPQARRRRKTANCWDRHVHGLKVEKTPGHPDLPQHLQEAHMEIRPGPNMTTRPEFKQAIKKLEPPAQ